MMAVMAAAWAFGMRRTEPVSRSERGGEGEELLR